MTMFHCVIILVLQPFYPVLPEDVVFFYQKYIPTGMHDNTKSVRNIIMHGIIFRMCDNIGRKLAVVQLCGYSQRGFQL